MRLRIGAGITWLPIAIATLVSLIACGFSAGFVTVGPDEYAKTLVASNGLRQPSLWFAEVWLPFHFILIAATSLVTHESFVASRLVSVFFGGILIAAVWRIGRQMGGDRAGGFAAMVAATHPLVLLHSATAMVDICYVALCILGVGLYLEALHSPRRRPYMYLTSCLSLTLACGFHYNAWIVVLLMIPIVLWALYQANLPRALVTAGLLILISFPLGWVCWYWIHSGHPLEFFSKHKDYSSTLFAHGGWMPTPLAVLSVLYANVKSYSPLLAILACCSSVWLFRSVASRSSLMSLWAILAGFSAALFLLYLRGGRPVAFDPRYILIPSMLMVLIVTGSIYGFQQRRSSPRISIALLAIALICINIKLYHDAIRMVTGRNYFPYIAEARRVARALRPLRSASAPKLLLEVKEWNFLALPVFLGRADAVLIDREYSVDPLHHFDGRTFLLGSREPTLARIRAMGAEYIAVWTPEVKQHISSWGLRRIKEVDTYAIYRMPRDDESISTRVPGPGMISR
jgi:hypothetical protein